MKSFFKNKGIAAGIFMMIFYQIIMITVFMSGYSAVPKNVTEMTVAIVNEDEQSGVNFVEQLEKQLPFHIVTNVSLEQAKQQLEDRDIQFIMHIPQNFTQLLSEQGEQAGLDYYVNQSNPATINSTMQSVMTQINDNIRSQIQTQSMEGILKSLNVPDEQAKELTDGVMNKITSNVVASNPQPAGMHNQMAPMFLTMGMYVGAMIYSMMSVSALTGLKGKMGKWKAFFSLQGVNALLALIIPLVGVTIYFAVQGYGAETFMKVWLIHAMELFAAIEFTSIFCMLLGQAGMLLNMPLLLIQTISNGAVMSQDIMPGFFRMFSHISVMFYTVQLDYNMLFGGGKTGEYLLGLILVGIMALLLNTVIHHFKAVKEVSTENEPALQPNFM